jgi:predicted adenine nucleotide alpha hydrolase (AANH) superfamily ATPase
MRIVEIYHYLLHPCCLHDLNSYLTLYFYQIDATVFPSDDNILIHNENCRKSPISFWCHWLQTTYTTNMEYHGIG